MCYSSVILSGRWEGAKDPLRRHEMRSVGGGSFAPTGLPLRMTLETQL